MRLAFRLFDQDLLIVSGSREFGELFRRMYRRFEVDGSAAPSSRAPDFGFLDRAHLAGGRPVLKFDGRSHDLGSGDAGEAYAYDVILAQVLRRVRSHVLIHGAAVSREGRGVVLAGEAGQGKSTLALALVRRGFGFLSDEMATLERASGRLVPFPRSLRLRPGTLELAGFPEAAAEAPEWMGKLLLDIDDICPDALGESVELSRVIVLGGGAAEDEAAGYSGDEELVLTVDRVDGELVRDVRALQGVLSAEDVSGGGLGQIRLRAVRPMAVLREVEALCEEQDVWILDASRPAGAPPCFDGEPRLTAIPHSVAALELLRRYLGGHHSALLEQDLGGSPTRLLAEIARLIRGAECYRLTPGPLGQMADLACGIMG